MCGIAGIISQNPNRHDSQYLDNMLKTMLHRGPDQTNVELFNRKGCFGHNRLSIIDLSDRAKQPMWDHARQFCLTFNGEIYNFPALRSELTKLGHSFRTKSDAEVLVQAWAEWGVDALHRLIGMFAFALWDEKHQQLYLVRDRMGEKPLYYAPVDLHFDYGIVFASELKGLLSYPFIEKKMSMTALCHYLSFNYTATDDAIFQGTYKLPPAHYLQYDLQTRQHKIVEYWSLAKCFHNKSTIHFDEAQHQLNHLLKEAIQGKMISDVPLGAFLSGGMDSSTIVSYMRDKDQKQIHTYSVGFNEKTYSELSLSAQTAHHLGVNHQAKIITADALQTIPEMIGTFDEPFADTSLIPTYLLCHFAKQHVTVSLSGDGGDELFGGYSTYQADRYFQFIKYFPLPIRKMLIKLSDALPVSYNKVSFDYKVRQFLQGSLSNIRDAHINWRKIFSTEQLKILFRPEYLPLLSFDCHKTALLHFREVENCHYLDQSMYVDIKTWLVDDILVKVDRASMANSLEVRAPFLDHRIVEFAAKMPVSYKIKKHQGKYILKTSQAKRLPKELLCRRKQGFNAPVAHWLLNDLSGLAYDVTTSSHLTQWFNKNSIEKYWNEHKRGIYDHGHRLFNLFCLGLWCQKYLEY